MVAGPKCALASRDIFLNLLELFFFFFNFFFTRTSNMVMPSKRVGEEQDHCIQNGSSVDIFDLVNGLI